MPILLTSSIQTGDLDTSGPYLHVKITDLILDTINKKITVTCFHGNDSGGIWTQGIKARDRFAIKNIPAVLDEDGVEITPADPQYDTIIAIMPGAGETIYQAASKQLYQWLLDKGHYVGTIVA